jgi:uncharacterized RDD family membrane protein YckC
VDPDERLRIDTPEQVALELPIAGVGSRFLAVAVDTVLQVVLFAVILFSVGFLTAFRAVPPIVRQAGPAVVILLTFCVYWGYFAAFETFWSGRTPGKRLAGIRVVKSSGRAINGYEAIARNVLRAIDFLPAMYGLGVVVMMLNRHSRRIGDYVAGTFVVHDRRSATVASPRSAAAPIAGPVENLARMTADELVLIETYLQRRAELEPWVRSEMAEQIVARIERSAGVRRDPAIPIDEFLETVARRIRDTARFR